MIYLQNRKFGKTAAPPIEEYGKSNLRKVLIRVLRASGAVLLGLLLSSAKGPLDTYPFVIALTASLSSGTGFAALGIVLRFIFGGAGMTVPAFTYSAAAVMIAAARWLFCLLFIGKKELAKTGRLTDDVTTRVLSACIASVGGALVTVFSVGFDTYRLIGGIFSACAAGAMTFLFVSLFDRRYFFPAAYEAGGLLLMVGVTVALSETSFHSLSPALIFAFGVTLWCGYCGGWARGCAAGLMLSLACGGGGIAELALFGLFGGLFFPVNCVASSSAALIALVACGAISGGIEKVLLFLPEALIGTSVITVMSILKIMPRYVPIEESSAEMLCRDITDKNARRKEL